MNCRKVIIQMILRFRLNPNGIFNFIVGGRYQSILLHHRKQYKFLHFWKKRLELLWHILSPSWIAMIWCRKGVLDLICLVSNHTDYIWFNSGIEGWYKPCTDKCFVYEQGTHCGGLWIRPSAYAGLSHASMMRAIDYHGNMSCSENVFDPYKNCSMRFYG